MIEIPRLGQKGVARTLHNKGPTVIDWSFITGAIIVFRESQSTTIASSQSLSSTTVRKVPALPVFETAFAFSIRLVVLVVEWVSESSESSMSCQISSFPALFSCGVELLQYLQLLLDISQDIFF